MSGTAAGRVEAGATDAAVIADADAVAATSTFAVTGVAPGSLSPELAAKVAHLDAQLDGIAARHQQVKLASSLAAEDMVLTHAILTHATLARPVAIGIFTLNTGRLHAETLEVLDRVQERYGYRIEEFHPQPEAVRAYVEGPGLNAFYESVELRKQCCGIRKVEPLNRALASADAWVTGQRREQSVTRVELQEAEHDDARGIAKYNPLADWSEADVWAYLQAFDVPVNPLHARGYPSIGCEPCTRAVRPGEDSRAGRWWWESQDTKECGLHLSPVASPVSSLPSSPSTPAAGSPLASPAVPTVASPDTRTRQPA